MTYIFHILVGFCMVVFHTTIVPNSSFFAGFYDLIAVFIVYMGFFRSPREAIPFVLFFGMVMDVFSGGIFGLYATAYFWLYVFSLGLTLIIRKNNMLLLPVVVLFGVVFENMVMIGITALMDAGAIIPETAVNVVAGQAIWVLFTGPVLIVAIKYVDDRWEKFAKSREKEFA
jgi:cell shape-determining protein MreD